jgi:hypothetical protein
MIPGVGLLIMEILSSQSGGMLFRKFDATKLYFLGFTGYAIVSTLIFLTLHLVFHILKRHLTAKAALFGHILPVAFGWVFLQLGLHDLFQDIWRDHLRKTNRMSNQVQMKIDRPRIRVPRPPLSKNLQYKGASNAIEPETQTAMPRSDR